ncbi:hypothetical protein BDF21DRAFT_493120 [Thamnidium elegans]|uniref:Uncharacterized protein n=1 Tax=Thamnidium elegans TaxID=101142 RepID=A0A8H7VQZ8_9FUNG|nr:hypothetical protein INT48_001083 [Thamnidium elegans]KAI8082377.1 hypothetical protein BDF21DRAFT_493120 [Thamnidium elegans]
MVRSIIFISAFFAVTSLVSAAPAAKLVQINAGHIGTGDIDIENVLNNFLSLNNLRIEDIIQYISIL